MGTNPSYLILAVSDLANKNMEHSVKFEFQINNETFFCSLDAILGTY